MRATLSNPFRRTIHEPTECGPFSEPLSFGKSPAELTPNTLKVIRRNGGKIPAIKLAEALAWNLHRLERIARQHGVDLTYRPPTDHHLEDAEPRGA